MKSVFMAIFLVILTVPSTISTECKHNVVIITSSDSSYQQQTASRIQHNIDGHDIRAQIISADDVSTLPQSKNTMYVAIGEYAVKTLDAFDSNAMVLRLNNRKIPDVDYTSTRSDLITAQPACKNLQLIKTLEPKWTTIGVLSSIDSVDTTAELTKCAIKYNLNLQVYAITDESDLLKTLKTAVKNNEVLLAVVDPMIYNSRTVKNILLTAYRHRRPVIGYSDSFVEAGAVAAIYTSPETAGDDAARILYEFFENNWQFKKNSYNSSDFSVSLNRQVATSIEITLPDTATILLQIKRMDAKR